MSTTPAPMGHNRPTAQDQADTIRTRLTDEYRSLLTRQAELIEAIERAPETIADEDTARRITDFAKQIHTCGKSLEDARTAEKQPYLNGGKAVDAFFKGATEPLAAGKKAMESRLTVFQRAKAEAERKRREEEARRAEEEARIRAAAMQDAGDLDSAIKAEEKAAAAQREARAKRAELSRTHGDYGAVSSLRKGWAFQVDDIHRVDLEKLRPYLTIDAVERAIRAFVKAGGRDLPGVRIFEEHKTVVR